MIISVLRHLKRHYISSDKKVELNKIDNTAASNYFHLTLDTCLSAKNSLSLSLSKSLFNLSQTAKLLGSLQHRLNDYIDQNDNLC